MLVFRPASRARDYGLDSVSTKPEQQMTTKTHVRKLTYQNVVPVLIALHTETMPCNVAVIAIAIAITNLIVITSMSKRMHHSASLDIYI